MLVWHINLTKKPSLGQSLPGPWYTPATLTCQTPGGQRRQGGNHDNVLIIVTCAFIPPSFHSSIQLTGRQARFADFNMRFMLSIGLKRSSCLSSPRNTFRPSNSWWEATRERKWNRRKREMEVNAESCWDFYVYKFKNNKKDSKIPWQILMRLKECAKLSSMQKVSSVLIYTVENKKKKTNLGVSKLLTGTAAWV